MRVRGFCGRSYRRRTSEFEAGAFDVIAKEKAGTVMAVASWTLCLPKITEAGSHPEGSKRFTVPRAAPCRSGSGPEP